MSKKERRNALPVPPINESNRRKTSRGSSNGADVNGFRDQRELAFAERFIETGLAAQSAIDVGYSVHTAKRNAISWTLPDGPKPHVYKHIQKYTKLVSQTVMDRVGISKEMIITEMAKLAFASVGDFIEIDKEGLAKVNLSKADKDKLAAISQLETVAIYEGRGKNRKLKGYETKVKLSDKRAALALLGKEAGLFADKVEHSGKDGEPLKVLIAPFEADVG